MGESFFDCARYDCGITVHESGKTEREFGAEDCVIHECGMSVYQRGKIGHKIGRTVRCKTVVSVYTNWWGCTRMV